MRRVRFGMSAVGQVPDQLSQGASVKRERHHVVENQFGSPGLHRRDDPRLRYFPRLDRRWVGDPVLPSEGFYAGLHNRARLYGRVNAGVPKAHCKIIGLSVDPVDNHSRWAKDIEETQGHAVTYPLIGDPQLKIAKLYDMLPEGVGDASEGRTPADNATVRSVFVIGPDKKVKATLTYPMTSGRNFDEVLRLLDSCQLTAKHQVAPRSTGSRAMM